MTPEIADFVAENMRRTGTSEDDIAQFTAKMPKYTFRLAERTRLNVGDVLFTEPIAKKVIEDRKMPVTISFNQPGVIEPEPALKTLHDMTNLVEGVVAGLGRFLP